MGFHGFFLSLFLVPAFAFAAPPPGCANGSQHKVFEEFRALTDEQISDRCQYDIEKLEPDADEARIKANVRRTSICESGLTKMREISQRYVDKQTEVCLKAKSAPTCADATSQSSCMVDAAKLAAEVKRGEEELSAIMAEGKEKLSRVSRFNRLLTAKFRRQQRELGLLPPEQKSKILPADPKFREAKPLPGRPDKALDPPANKPGISAADPVEPPRPSKISPSDPGARTPSEEMRPREYGARSLAEYERKLPFLIQQHENTAQQLQRFEEARATKQAEHRVAASEMAAKATQFFATAEKLGYAGRDLAEWKKENSPTDTTMAAPPAATPAAWNDEKENLAAEPENLPAPAPQAAPRGKKKDPQPASLPPVAALPDPEPAPSEDPALSSFTSKLGDQSQTPATAAERSRLRELLKRRMQAQKSGETAKGLEEVPGAFVADILAETKLPSGREPQSEMSGKSEAGSVDVESALRDMEAQLAELDRQAGILESSSRSLFERVSLSLKKHAESLEE